ncbi:hypothetical protein K1T71_009451 [Dendrolimus kikuchii]|uniref:Uncharacterized protein n=1 Tax=Dendrolimus kikuchii TaxID=765133 RepID=A0ACC1CV22_9NEOP|nr:hypothetical protein K1T71_009451 [Dendrolimus kikuchii]
MDITPLFNACIKTVKTRNKTFGIPSPVSEDKQRIFRTKPQNGFMCTARDITSQITRLRDFLLQHREKYLSFYNNSTGDEMSDAERDQIDTGAQRIINTCSHLLKEFRNDNRKVPVSSQTREYMDAVTDLIDMYLKAVCKIHSELKALRVKRAIDIRKLSRLELPKTKSSIPNPFVIDKKEKTKENPAEDIDNVDSKKSLNLSENDVAVLSDEGELSAEELQMFESENLQLLNELNSMTEEVRQIESKVLHIAELQEIFTEKVLQQEQDIDRISNTVVGATENVKDANEQIKQAIQRNAGLRVYFAKLTRIKVLVSMFRRFQLIKKIFGSGKNSEHRSVCVSKLKIMDGVKAMRDLGYMFNEEGQLRKLDKDGNITDKPFQFNISDKHQECQTHYEELGTAVTYYIYHLLENELNLKKLPVPKQDKDGGTFIFVSEDYDKKDVLLILIHGSGVVRAGQWARSLIINENLDVGTQIPYIKKALSKDYGVIVLNTNDSCTEDGKAITHSNTAEKHAKYVWENYIAQTSASSIAIIGHSYGGVVTVSLADEVKKDFEKRVKAVALTDSVHGYSNKKISKFLKEVSKNWISSKSALDSPMKTPDFEIARVSAGHERHEMTSHSCIESVFKFIDQKLSKK